MKRHSYNALVAFVGRADTLDKVDIAEDFIRKIDYLRPTDKARLLASLQNRREELDIWEDDCDEDRNWSPSAPWNAPGMRVSDFISGVCYF